MKWMRSMAFSAKGRPVLPEGVRQEDTTGWFLFF
jgi:hypothetical protein